MIPEFKIKFERHEKKGFHASDYGKPAFDLYHSFKGTEPTNPARWNDTLKWGAGKGVELQMIRVLKDTGIVDEAWDQDKEPTYEMERSGIKVRMKIDAIVGNNEMLGAGSPIEIKSINNKNSYDIRSYADGKPRENYVGQLAIYMDYLNKDLGYLFVASVDGLSYFWLACRKVSDKVYQCGQVTVDLNKEYARWADLKAMVDNNLEPSVTEYGRYKIPLAEIDWKKLSISEIAKARAGEKVIGDPEAWKILYSPYKDLILKEQGVTAGYTDEEINIIKGLTKGYSAKK